MKTFIHAKLNIFHLSWANISKVPKQISCSELFDGEIVGVEFFWL